MNKKEKEQLDKASRAIERMGGFSVRDCNKCAHDTLHQFHDTWYGGQTYLGDSKWRVPFYRCLTCGTDWVDETVAKELPEGVKS